MSILFEGFLVDFPDGYQGGVVINRYGQRLRELRAERRLSLREVEERGGPNKDTMSLIERGVHRPHPRTLGRIAQALDMSVAELRSELEAAEHPLVEAPPSLQLPLNGFEDERLTSWRAAVDNARRLRETGWGQMWKALSGWGASKKCGEPYATRRKYLDEMGKLLQEVYDMEATLGQAFLDASLMQGDSEASGPRSLLEESGMTRQFYGELLGLIKSARLSVLTGDDATAARREAEVQPGQRPVRVAEPKEAA
jgi:transcriptional regulator with XRE-family HTH domain